MKLFHLDTCGIFMDILENAWDPKFENETFERIEAYLRKVCKIIKPSAVSRFMIIHSGQPEHSHLNFKTPWIWKGDKINLQKWQRRYWQLDKRYLKLLGELGINDLPQAFMRSYYNSFLNRNENKQGINGLLDPKALKVEKQYVTRLVKRQIRHGLDPNIIFVNEIAHGGSDETYHQIANWHRDLWLHLKEKTYIELTSIWADTSHSEATRAQLVYHGSGDAYCPKCGVYKWDNILEYGRDCRAIKHRIGIIDDLEREDVSFKAWKGSANWGGKGSEDGSQNPKAKIVPIKGLKWRIGSPEQVGEMLDYIWTNCHEAGRRKEYTWGLFHMGQFSLQDGVIKSYFHDRLPAVYWERLDVVGQKHREFWGE